MSKAGEVDPRFGPLFRAGHFVEAGSYRNVDTGAQFILAEAGLLPPSFNGQVATYIRSPRTWEGICRQRPLAEQSDGCHSLNQESRLLPRGDSIL
ncbi:MAG: hypothetical protein H7Z41_02050 [Cytophagales bacterium]|nr:hypothetical protein [Armatimonadota bacterium]